jgi:hypothetical protein
MNAYEDNLEYNDSNQQQEQFQYLDRETDDYFDDDSDDDYEDDDNPLDNNDSQDVESWTRLRLNGHIFMISTMGRLKPYDDPFAIGHEGFVYPGTPYRFWNVGTNKYFVHELVWLAFKGDITDGYEVRHEPYYVQKKPHRTYSNNIEHLCLQKVMVCKLQTQQR